MISEQQYGFMPRKNTADEMFALRLLKKCREGQKVLLCVFVDLEKAYNKFSKRNCNTAVRKSGGRKVCEGRDGHVRGQQDSGKVCNR